MRRSGLVRGVAGVAALVAAPLAVLALTVSPAGATTTITVTSSADAAGTCPSASTCTLRQAFADASAAGADVQINIPASVGNITLTAGQLVFSDATHALTVSGGGVTVTQTTAARVILSQTSGTLTIDSITLTGGNATGSRGGAFRSLGPIVITNSTLTNNSSQFGGGAVFATNGPVTVTGSTITHNESTDGSGGGIRAQGGDVIVTNSTVSNNSADCCGGGVYANVGKVTVTNSTFSTNTAANDNGGGVYSDKGSGTAVAVTGSTFDHNTADNEGGAVYSAGAVTVTGSTFSTNTAHGDGGGGIYAGSVAGPVTVSNSTFNANVADATAEEASIGSADVHEAVDNDTGAGIDDVPTVRAEVTVNPTGVGGAIFTDGLTSVTNSTITGNTAAAAGGGIYTCNSVTLVYATVVSNSSPTGANIGCDQEVLTAIGPASGPLTSFGSVVALHVGGGTDCFGFPTVISQGYNFSDDTSCGFTAGTDKQNGGNPGLGALANNGGTTLTELPQSTSPLLNAIPTAHCSDGGASTITPLVDQIGLTRPQATGCEIGAKEVPFVAKFTG